MAFQPLDRAAAPAARETSSEEKEGRSGFQVPASYVEHYLHGEFLPIVTDGQSQALAAREERFSEDLAAWLWQSSGLPRHLQAHEAPTQDGERLLRNLAELGEFERAALKKWVEAQGTAEALTRALGPAALSVLASGQYSPPPPDQEQPDDQNAPPVAHFDSLLAGSAERQKTDDPEPVLETLSRLSPQDFDATMAEVHRWQPLANVLGAGFARVVGEKRYQPLAEALARGTVDAGERATLLQGLARLGPEETAALKAHIEERKSEQALTRLLGRPLKLWLGGIRARLDLDDPPRPATVQPRKRREDDAPEDDLLEEETGDKT